MSCGSLEHRSCGSRVVACQRDITATWPAACRLPGHSFRPRPPSTPPIPRSQPSLLLQLIHRISFVPRSACSTLTGEASQWSNPWSTQDDKPACSTDHSAPMPRAARARRRASCGCSEGLRSRSDQRVPLAGAAALSSLRPMSSCALRTLSASSLIAVCTALTLPWTCGGRESA
jgi:hypothetical protein